MGRDYGPMYNAEIRARKTGKLNADGARPMSAADLINIELPEGTKPKIMNAVIPVVFTRYIRIYRVVVQWGWS